jgi:hypothetical protein
MSNRKTQPVFALWDIFTGWLDRGYQKRNSVDEHLRKDGTKALSFGRRGGMHTLLFLLLLHFGQRCLNSPIVGNHKWS